MAGTELPPGRGTVHALREKPLFMGRSMQRLQFFCMGAAAFSAGKCGASAVCWLVRLRKAPRKVLQLITAARRRDIRRDDARVLAYVWSTSSGLDRGYVGPGTRRAWGRVFWTLRRFVSCAGHDLIRLPEDAPKNFGHSTDTAPGGNGSWGARSSGSLKGNSTRSII